MQRSGASSRLQSVKTMAAKKRFLSRFLTVAFLFLIVSACSSPDDDADLAAVTQEESATTTSLDGDNVDPVSPSNDAAPVVEVTAQGGLDSTTTSETESDATAESASDGADDAGSEGDDADPAEPKPDSDTEPEADSKTEPDTAPAEPKPDSEPEPDTETKPEPTPAATTGNARPDLVFDWTAGAKPTAGSRVSAFAGNDFWIQGINCSSDYNQAHAESTRVTFGVTSPSRFAGERSVEFFTDRGLLAPCNDHLVPHRAEMSISNNRTINNRYAKFRNGGGVVTENSPTLGIDTGSVGSPGSVVWFGWSERYGEIDTSHTTTLWQLRSNCGTGSPAVALAYRPDSPYGKGEGIYLLTQSANGNVQDNYNYLAPLTAGGWRDFVMEVGYSYEDQSGFVKVWHSEVDSNGRSTFDYNNPAVFRRSATLYGVDAPLPANANNVDECPHIRWGLYRHDGSKVPPEQVPEANRVMTKYVSPVRLLVGQGLGQQGLDAVTPRPVSE